MLLFKLSLFNVCILNGLVVDPAADMQAASDHSQEKHKLLGKNEIDWPARRFISVALNLADSSTNLVNQHFAMQQVEESAG